MEYHIIYLTNFDIPIMLFLYGVLSYAPTYNISIATLEGTYEIYLMTPKDRCNPESDAYVNREESIMYWQVNITDKRDRIKMMLEDLELYQ